MINNQSPAMVSASTVLLPLSNGSFQELVLKCKPTNFSMFAKRYFLDERKRNINSFINSSYGSNTNSGSSTSTTGTATGNTNNSSIVNSNRSGIEVAHAIHSLPFIFCNNVEFKR